MGQKCQSLFSSVIVILTTDLGPYGLHPHICTVMFKDEKKMWFFVEKIKAILVWGEMDVWLWSYFPLLKVFI